MPAIYANDFGGLTAANQNAQALRQQAMQGALQNFMRVSAENKNAKYQDAALKQRQSESAAANIDRAMSLGLAYANSKRAAQYQEWLMKQPTATQEKERSLVLDQATQDADTGTFDSPAHVKQLYPQFNDQDAAVMFSRSRQAREQLTSTYDVASKAARTLTMPDQIKRSLASVMQSDPSYFGGKEGQAAAIADLTDKLQTAKEVATRIGNDKRLQQLVIYDPDSNQYVPAVARPRWLQVDQSKPAPDLTPPRGMISPGKGGMRGVINISPNDVSVTRTSSPAVPAPTKTGGQFDQQFYNRVNELISSGNDPVSAKRQAMQERTAQVP